MAVPFLRAHPTATRRSALGLLLLVAFILRVWNLDWDEGTHQHPDERHWSIVTSDISGPSVADYFDSENSSLNPYNHHDSWVYGTFPLFTTKAASSFLADGPFPAGAIVTTATAAGIDLRNDGVDAFDSGYNANLVGRLLGALVDTATVLLVYLLARDLFDRRAGFVAAGLLAFTPLHIQYAHFYGSEPWVAFFVTAGVWLSLKLACGDLRLRTVAATGAIIGLAMASKLIAFAALVVPAIAIMVAVVPAIVALARRLWSWLVPWAKADMVRTGAISVALPLGGVAVLLASPFGLKALLVLAVGLVAVVVTGYALGIVLPAERRSLTPRVLFDQDAQPPNVLTSPAEPDRSSLDVVAWGAFSGMLVLFAAALTYRVFQPYTFDGLASVDPRFTRDLEFLEGVNSGGNVPWVVQWIGRTPLLFPLKSAFLWGMGPALGLAVVVGIVASVRAVLVRQRWELLLPLGFLAIMLGLVSQQFNPLIRYLLPAYPVAAALGAFGVITLWDIGVGALSRPTAGARLGGRGLQLVASAMVVVTAFWGLAFVNGIYNTEHPRIEASVWMAENLPDGAVLSTQTWDDSLPLGVAGTEGFNFIHVAFDLFQPDVVDGKVQQLIDGLDHVDYVVEASNRLYDSIPRVPAKYPSTTAYYEALFDGRLGFEQIAEFQNTPSLFGIDIPDAGAEETFTVYDHPTVTIWAKTDTWSVERATAILNPAQSKAAVDIVPSASGTNALQFGPNDVGLVETGNTFNETFESEGLIPSVPWVFWLLWIQLAAFAVLPWTTTVFSRLPDKGYGLSKVIGFVGIGLGVWLTVSWDLIDYSRSLSLTWFGATAVVGLIAWGRGSERMTGLFRDHRRSWIMTELVFLGVFALALWMRSANPDLWEAHLGGEKPMEMAYLTSIARSSELPAVDPWFAGGFMNYYYFGWFLLTVPMRAMRILPEVAFNLGVATYAALTAATAFSIVHNLVALSRERWAKTSHESTSPVPARAGLLGVLLLLGIGNLDAIRLHYRRLELVNEWQAGADIPVIGHIMTFLGGSWAWATGTNLQRFDWWAPSRVNQGNFDITEFPYFTFLFGDLHPHMMGMVFIGLTVSLALAYLLASRDGAGRSPLLLAVGLGLATGLVRMVNTWDLPSVVIVAAIAIVVGRSIAVVQPKLDARRSRSVAILIGVVGLAVGASHVGGPGSSALVALFGVGAASMVAATLPAGARHRLLSVIGHLSVVAVTHILVFWPYLRSNEAIDTGLQSALAGSPLDDFLVHWGIFLTLAVALALALLVDARRRAKTNEPNPGPLPTVVWASPLWKGVWLGLSAVTIVVTGRVSTGAATIAVAGTIIYGMLFLTEARRPSRDLGRLMATGLFMLGFAIAGGVDIITVENDIERMNTVFKFWLQSWQYFALAGGFAIWQVGRIASERPAQPIRVGMGQSTEVRLQEAKPWRMNVWGIVVALLLLAGLAYPALATRTRLETRFAQIPATLDGLAYLDADPVIRRLGPNNSGPEISVSLADDLPLIEWIRENVEGTPVLVEWSGGGYDWNSRMAIHTGLPTVLGWDWHQKQQRWDYQVLIDNRLQDIQTFYTAGSVETITSFLQTYKASYVIVGTQEHRFGSPESLSVIASHPALEVAFESASNVIYRVKASALWPGLSPVDVDLLALTG
jgi:YYY domain-containing protein